MEKEKEVFVNPIDPKKVAENPHLLPYAHTVGGVVIQPLDKGKVKGIAMAAMYEQTDMHLDQIRKQIELLAQQARAITDRVAVSEKIYQAEIGFEPVIGKQYHLYKRANGKHLLSLIAPAEWGAKIPYDFVASVHLLSDHTWEVLAQAKEI